MISEGKVNKLAKKILPSLKGIQGKNLRKKVSEISHETGVDYVKLMKKVNKMMGVKEDEEEQGAVETPEETPEVTPDKPEPEDTGEPFKDLDMDPGTAKALDGLEGKFGIRPDFDMNGYPGFYTADEKEWYANMRATRQRMRFRSDGKIAQFMRKHPHSNFYVRNPNKSSDFMYPATRKKSRGRA